MFTHLNLHSVYSAMRGLLSLQDIIELAKVHRMSHLAMTDVNGLWGFIRFVQHCKQANIEPIAGTHLITPKEELILLVENQIGYHNLCHIISSVHDDPGASIVSLVRGKISGLFMLAHQESVIDSLAKLVPNSHLFVELRPGLQEKQAQNLSKTFNVEMVVTGDIYFKHKIDHQAHVILRAIEKNTTLEKLDQSEYKTDQHWFRGEAEMISLFPNSLDAINNSHYLAERCKTDWSFVNTIFPDLSLKKTHRANKDLKERVIEGAKQRYGTITPAISDRIHYELDLITQKGFAPYFLIVQDIVQQTRSTIGRGSAAASIISYCLFITQVDPLKYMLQFERFIHPEREDMPDIDVDFPWDERDDILAYVFEKYGNKHTAMVSSQVFLKPRSAVREVGKVYGLSNEEIKSITKRIGWYASRRDLEKWVKTDPRFANVDLDETLMTVLRLSGKIIGTFRHPSVHPGGVIITPDSIRKYVPVLMAPKGVQIVEWEKDQVEDSGLLKIDLLGNRSLAVVRDTLKQVNLNGGHQKTDTDYADYHQIQPVGDPKTEALMQAGKTMGIFYIESPATRQLLAKAGVVDFEHVVIYSSIIRPAANRFTTVMLRRIHGEPWTLLHPDLEFLSESYGIMVYEEQVSTAARVLAGLGYAEADALRKTMSRDSMQHLIQAWKKKFTYGALERGYEPELIEQVWDMIKSFVGYSFCKPHSASYAMLSFTCAYLKSHYTSEFLASVVSNQGGFYSAYAYLSEAKRFGIRILLPDINKSGKTYKGYDGKICMGFMSIKHLQKQTIDSILDERKAGLFDSLDDFLLRVDLALADAMALTNAGCFNEIAYGLTHRDLAYRIAGFYLQKGVKEPLDTAPVSQEISSWERHQLEIDVFGFPITLHPLAPYRSLMSPRIQLAKNIPCHVGRVIYLTGVYITRKESVTRKHEPMEFLTLEDESDIYECVLFPDAFKEYGDLLHWESLFILRGRVEEAFGVYTVTIEKLASLQQWMRKSKKYVS
ncbi:MAG: DNA polymerase III subunit alpha [Candidatus Marinimicrobia bacterium]|nr:DNA polymerase III subunit alpha [Candidatus Neomarinimicrobiota bacterium]